MFEPSDKCAGSEQAGQFQLALIVFRGGKASAGNGVEADGVFARAGSLRAFRPSRQTFPKRAIQIQVHHPETDNSL